MTFRSLPPKTPLNGCCCSEARAHVIASLMPGIGDFPQATRGRASRVSVCPAVYVRNVHSLS
eukprot:5327877-Alexandrium_andersonii.AAC.1